MFESLSGKLQGVLKSLRGQGKLTEKNISDALREVRLALLEADVDYKTVREFIDGVRARSIGQEVLGSFTSDLQIAKIIGDELAKLMGEEAVPVTIAPSGPTIIMMVGLQGGGKTTASAKLALRFKSEGRNPLLGCSRYLSPSSY